MLETLLIVDESQLVREALSKILLNYGTDKAAIASVETIDDAIEFSQFSNVSIVICANIYSPEQLLQFQQQLSNDISTPFLLLAKHHGPLEYQLEKHYLLNKPFTQERVGNALFQLTNDERFKHTLSSDKKSSSRLSELLSTANNDEKSTILVVDDESINIDVAAGSLRENHRVIAAKSGQQALKILAKDNVSVDLILLDVMMPDIDGYQVCESLKQNSATKDIPVIFLSAKTQVNDIKNGFELGAVDYITKPINPELLRARVATHVRLKRHSSALKHQICALKENAKLREDIEKIVQHDLKGPLNNILFETHKLDNTTIAKSINSAVNNVVNMINNSLNVYKIEQGIYNITPKEISLNTIIIDALNAFQSLSASKNIKINIDSLSTEYLILAEPLLCLSIFNNVIKNAIEASPNNSQVLISLTKNKTTIMFRILNEGVIPLAIRSTLFDKYSSSNHSLGTGLGTYSAKLMTEVQHGRIYFDIIDEKQTAFFVELPAVINNTV